MPEGLCAGKPAKIRAPLRRLTRFEYNNTVRDLLGDASQPANAFPAEDIGNGFGNDADSLSVSSFLAQQYADVAEGIALRATQTPQRLAALAPCAATATAANEEICARSFIEGFLPRAYRRPVQADEATELVALYRTVRARPGSTFATSVAGVIEAVLQTPDFLYRLEWGAGPIATAGYHRLTGHEMATRLSYLLWGTMPDDDLLAAAARGDLSRPEGVLAKAKGMLADPRARATVAFFFNNLLPIASLADLERDKAQFPTFSAEIGALMQKETQKFLENVVFEEPAGWPTAFSARYTFANEALAKFYGIPGVSGPDFRRVPLDTNQRLGLLTQAGILAGTTHSNATSPVVRGSFVVRKLLCNSVPLPSADLLAKVKPPDPYSGATARQRYSQHSADPLCASCHALMDPVGLALENFDPVGLYREKENGVVIDAHGSVPGTDGVVNGPVELASKIASTQAVNDCLASHWVEFGYGRTVGADDACAASTVQKAFTQSRFQVRDLLLALTQTDTFLYLPAR